MYPYELGALIQQNNSMLGGEDLLRAISPEENNLCNVKFIPEENKYYLKDKDGNHFEFVAITYKEAMQEKGKVLVKNNQ